MDFFNVEKNFFLTFILFFLFDFFSPGHRSLGGGGGLPEHTTCILGAPGYDENFKKQWKNGAQDPLLRVP